MELRRSQIRILGGLSWLLSATPLLTTWGKCQHLWTCHDFGFAIIRSTVSHSCECQSDSSWSSSVFWRFFGWSFLPWSLGMFGSRGWSFYSSVIPLFVSFLLFFGSVEPQGVCWNIWALVSLVTPQCKYIQTRTPSCIYFTIRNVICLIIRVLSLHGSIISNTEHKKSQRNTTEAQFSFFLRVLTARDNQRQHRELIWCSEMWAKIEMSWIAPVVVGEKRKHNRGAQGMHCFCFFEGRNS